ncbi:HAD family hydrolase [Streptomyces celluloflavus]|uniref:HAD family hydrolase n=1 Tax=Streptomyces celluloflavus TaxID=58344 RepID=UPI0037BA0E78
MPLVLFDLDNTLVDRGYALTEAVSQLCTANGYGPQIETWMHAELATRAHPADFARLRAMFALPDSGEDLWQAYTDAMTAAVSCRPEVLAALTELRTAGWTIGVVTNGASDIQRAKLAATGLDQVVDGVAVSGDLGIRKPDPQLFHLAARRCGHDLTEGGWMCGDNPDGDIGGGRQAGLRTVWLRGRPWPAHLGAPEHTVDNVLEAIGILRTHDHRR